MWAYLWAAPATALGLALAVTAVPRGRARVVAGGLEAHGPALAWLLARGYPRPHGIAAITLGHVVLARDHATLETTREHERAHVRQYERWGPFFVPAYLLASALAVVKGGHPYFDNPFEREARAFARRRTV